MLWFHVLFWMQNHFILFQCMIPWSNAFPVLKVYNTEMKELSIRISTFPRQIKCMVKIYSVRICAYFCMAVKWKRCFSGVVMTFTSRGKMYRANQANFDPLIIACIKHTLKGDTNRTHAKVASLFVNSNRMAARCAECHKHSLEFLIGPASANCTLRWEAELLISMRVNKH